MKFHRKFSYGLRFLRWRSCVYDFELYHVGNNSFMKVEAPVLVRVVIKFDSKVSNGCRFLRWRSYVHEIRLYSAETNTLRKVQRFLSVPMTMTLDRKISYGCELVIWILYRHQPLFWQFWVNSIAHPRVLHRISPWTFRRSSSTRRWWDSMKIQLQLRIYELKLTRADIYNLHSNGKNLLYFRWPQSAESVKIVRSEFNHFSAFEDDENKRALFVWSRPDSMSCRCHWSWKRESLDHFSSRSK